MGDGIAFMGQSLFGNCNRSDVDYLLYFTSGPVHKATYSVTCAIFIYIAFIYGVWCVWKGSALLPTFFRASGYSPSLKRICFSFLAFSWDELFFYRWPWGGSVLSNGQWVWHQFASSGCVSRSSQWQTTWAAQDLWYRPWRHRPGHPQNAQQLYQCQVIFSLPHPTVWSPPCNKFAFNSSKHPVLYVPLVWIPQMCY